jgi:enamine deaminase RidA (YjgF/YER057c/UK114 family)
VDIIFGQESFSDLLLENIPSFPAAGSPPRSELRREAQPRTVEELLSKNIQAMEGNASLQAVSAVSGMAGQIAPPALPEKDRGLFVEANSERASSTIRNQNQAAMAKIRSTLENALGDYAWIIKTGKNTTPLDLFFPVFETSEPTHYLALLAAVSSDEDKFHIVLATTTQHKFWDALETRASKLGIANLEKHLQLNNGGANSESLIRTLQRESGNRSLTGLKGVLAAQEELLKEVGYSGSARILQPQELKEVIGAVLASAYLRDTVKDPKGINRLDEWMRERGIDGAQFTSRMLQAFKEIDEALSSSA